MQLIESCDFLVEKFNLIFGLEVCVAPKSTEFKNYLTKFKTPTKMSNELTNHCLIS